MTIFEQTLRSILIAANLVSDRVFLIRAPQVPQAKMVYPFIVFFHIAPTPYYAHDGPLTLLEREYQVSLFDLSQSKALAMADTLRQYLETQRGDYAGAAIYSVFYRTQTHAYETDTKLFQIVQEYRIQFSMQPGGTFSQPAVLTRSIVRR
jgi:hypothetical protein